MIFFSLNLKKATIECGEIFRKYFAVKKTNFSVTRVESDDEIQPARELHRNVSACIGCRCR